MLFSPYRSGDEPLLGARCRHPLASSLLGVLADTDVCLLELANLSWTRNKIDRECDPESTIAEGAAFLQAKQLCSESFAEKGPSRFRRPAALGWALRLTHAPITGSPFSAPVSC